MPARLLDLSRPVAMAHRAGNDLARLREILVTQAAQLSIFIVLFHFFSLAVFIIEDPTSAR